MAKAPENHRWQFFRAGGVDQVRIGRGSDLAALGDLDLKNWVALACPTRGLDFDERTLALLDTDGDGRIRAPEIRSAVRWLCKSLKDPDVVFGAGDRLDPNWIDQNDDDGARVLTTLRRLQRDAGLEPSAAITVEHSVNATHAMTMAPLNGDGVVPPASIDAPELQAIAQQVLDCVGGVLDRSGEPGLDSAAVDRFFEELAAYAAWRDLAAKDSANVLPLDDDTGAAMDAVRAVADKVEDFFARTRLAAFDSRATALMNRSEADLITLASGDLTSNAPQVAALPLARIEPDRPLPLVLGLNPAWVGHIATLRSAAVDPLLGKGKTTLTQADWETLRNKLSQFEAWQAAKAGSTVEGLGLDRVAELLASDAKTSLLGWIERDLAMEPEMSAVVDVERLVRYVRDLPTLLDNYISFDRFYSAKEKAVFQAGTLYIDERACDLCMRVYEPARHAMLAGQSRMYLLYCDCTRSSGEKLAIVAAVTNGDSDNLLVGRNGVFFDRKGQDWDATITKIVENPMSLRQAFWSPYKKVLRAIEDMMAKRAAAAEAESDKRMDSAAQAAANADKTASAPAAPKKIDVGTVAAIGVAVGGLTAALGLVIGAFFELGYWIPVGILGLLLLISGPSVLIAWMKLRKRNVGPVLDASGWALNSLTRVNTTFGAKLTSIASIPSGATRSMKDPYQPKRKVWPWVVTILVVLGLTAWGLHASGYLGEWLGYADPPVEMTAPAPDPVAPEAPPAEAPAPAPTPAPEAPPAEPAAP